MSDGYTFEVKRMPVQQTLTIRDATTPNAIARTLGELLPEVADYLDEQRITPASPPFTRYHSFTEDRVDLEAGIVVTEPILGRGRVQPSELPGGEVLVTVHVGPYDRLGDAYRAIERWLAENDRTAGGAPWELYRTDPELTRVEEWSTEIYQPLA